MRDLRPLAVLCSVLIIFALVNICSPLAAEFFARDPGPRGAPIGAGNPISGLNPQQREFFLNGLQRFAETDSVSGKLPGESGTGLGPTFNSNQCANCHAQPAMGGSSPSRWAFPNIGPNPQVALASLDGATNIVPYFITEDGPVRAARFKYFLDSHGRLSRVRDGGVHGLFTIRGRVDATNAGGMTGHIQTCRLAQPDFEQMHGLNNLSLRIPAPLFGSGLIENIAESTIVANQAANSELKRSLGIGGHPNRNPNDGTITRFGWKAQNKSLLIFAGEAYNVEMGASNEVFPNKRGYAPESPPAECIFNPTPEDHSRMTESMDNVIDVLSDVVQFANFMRYLDQPMAACEGSGCSQSVQNGRTLFSTVGCALCHTPSMKTAASYMGSALSNKIANLYSDLLVHHMGSGLADEIIQGDAGSDEFRTAPLWGVGQRVFFLHDGRTQDLCEAIRQHVSPGSEANGVVSRYNRLTEVQKQDLLNFLRSR